MLTATMFLDSVLDVFKPIVQLWNWAILNTLSHLLLFLYTHVQAVPPLAAIGAYGVAVVILTLLIKLLLAPLQQFQLVTSRRSMMEQRKLSPQLSELRKKYRKDPQKLQAETMKLYKEHGVNPFGSLIGCLPLIVQMPVLIALYWVFTNFSRYDKSATPFLFIPNLNDSPSHHLLVAGVPIPVLAYLVLPILAAVTTLIQSRMMQVPVSATASDQEMQTQQMQRMMVLISPLMIGFFALNVPAGLGLYWFVGNCVSIIQQSFVVGWGNVLPARFRPNSGPQPPAQKAPGGGPRRGPQGAPGNGSKGNGSRRQLPPPGAKPKRPRA